jgi:hypothetical protein
MIEGINYNQNPDEIYNRVMHQLDVIVLFQKLENAVKVNNIEIITEIMNPNYLPNLTKEDKELKIFNKLYYIFSTFNMAENFLEYLIFDYNISAANSIDKTTNRLHPKIKAMFEIRELNVELNTNDKIGKKLKV